ncbi:hypothetical protein FRC98_11540 [Lujinxingia vulgaris]|uniref:Uncharacterized protein n=1 Tax=Lujinxingia vulgaris TaxID=2600176 RepID=A0A5C6XGZ0_9DELT|nr:hypothetical protein [Lujinxingia vulgaris]TXD36468.1 hypothetical protein FRC98_11540 [Lujinxingia vulgaris]
MFRIKTDIRHYKCDSREKVEKLIRNWVIRPADLLLDPSSESWAPIGDHPSFAPLFSTLEEAHQNTPDTVVTTRQSTEPSANDASPPPAINRPERDEMPTPALGVLRPARSARKAPPAPTPDPDDFPAPPEPPEGVVDPVRDSGEITMMTERTLELLSADDDSAPTKGDTDSADSASDEDAEASSPEDSSPDEASPEDATADIPLRRLGRHDLPEDLFATAELSKPELDEAPRIDELAELDAPPAADDDTAGPDEVTALRELPPLSDDNDDENEDTSLDETSETRARWNISLNSPPEDDQDEDDLDEDSESDGDLDEDSASEDEHDLHEDSESDDEHDLDEDSESDDEHDLDEDSEHDDDLDEDSEPEDEHDPDEKLIVAQAIGPDLELDEDALDQAIDDLEGAATAARERADDEDDEAELEEVPVEKAKRRQNLDFVSSGYAMELPITIGPSEELLEAGIVRSTLSEAQRDRRLPRPAPKKSGYRITHTFDLSPPPPSTSPLAQVPGGARTLIAAALVIVIIALLVAIL